MLTNKLIFTRDDVKRFGQCPFLFKTCLNKNESFAEFYSDDSRLDSFIQTYLNIDRLLTDSRSFYQVNGWYRFNQLPSNKFNVDIAYLHHMDDEVTLYYFYPIKKYSKSQVYDLISQLTVLEENHIHVTQIYLILMNTSYRYNGRKLKINQLFKLSNWFIHNGRKLYTSKLVKDYRTFDLYGAMKHCANSNDTVRNERCSRHDCQLYEQCHHSYYQHYNQHFIDTFNHFGDNLTQLQYAQYQSILHNKVFADQYALQHWLNKWEYPYYFIDFEWDIKLIPQYQNQFPLKEHIFAISLYKTEASKDEYKVLLCGDDCEEIVDQMIDFLGDKGTIFAYNANNAEKIRLLELCQYFSDKNEKIYRIINRLASIDIPIIYGMIYHNSIKGSFTLKNVVKCISSLNYDESDINNGALAVRTYQDWRKSNEITDKLKLENYSKLDAQAMIVLLNWYRFYAYAKEV